MGTLIRPELSKKNCFWIDKHRYYELKHFCLQYPMWKQIYESLDGLSKKPINPTGFSKSSEISDPTSKCAVMKTFYRERIDMLENTARLTDRVLGSYILKGVTEGITYDCLKARIEIPCCRSTYYELYRKFFWLLSEARK